MQGIIVVTAKKEDWEKAQQSSEYTQSTVDSTLEEVGFIHCSFPEQVMDMVNRKYSAYDNLVFLLIDPQKVKAEIKYEAARSGRNGTFPHIYGPLNTDAVFLVVPVYKAAGGQFVTPPELTQA